MLSRRASTLALASALLALPACSSVPNQAGTLASDAQRERVQTAAHQKFGLKLEIEDPMPLPALTSVTRALFSLKSHRFGLLPAGHPFIRYFGSRSIQAIFPYLRDRVHHLGVMSEEASAPGLTMYAANTGALMWLNKQESYIGSIRKWGNRVDSVHSPRYGLIELSPSTLIEAKTHKESDAESMWHLAAIVHEARHSDCSTQNPGATCSHIHVVCKTGSLTEGVVACDSDFNGAYSFEYVALRAMIRSCQDCDRRTLFTLKAYAFETASHLNAVPDPVTREIKQLLGNIEKKAPNLAKTLEASLNRLLAQVDRAISPRRLPAPSQMPRKLAGTP